MNEIYVHENAQKEKNSKDENVEGEDDDEEMTIEDGSKEDLVVDEKPKVVEEKPTVVEEPKGAKEKEEECGVDEATEEPEKFQYEEGLKQLQSLCFPDNEML